MKNIPKSGNYSSSFNTFVFDVIPKGSLVLDVGCWNGNLGASLIKEKNCSVDGVDVNKEALKEACKRGYEDTFLLNLNNSPLPKNKILKKYDVIVFADILEHLINPSLVLNYFKEYLKEGGLVVVSLPNVAFLLNRLNLLFGKWDYTEFGTLDKTHLKFFTLKTSKELVKDSGFTLQSALGYNQFSLLRKLDFFTNISPNLFSYQFLILGKKDE